MDDIFSWKSVKVPDSMQLERWLGTTGEVEREFPLAVALQVHDELEHAFTAGGEANALTMAEVRGGMKALKRFAQLYSKFVERE